MEIRKVLRKVTAVAASASFIGATMLGAVAQDLSAYPSPFVSNGMFDALIVVGSDAQPQDVVGAVDIGASLQFSLKKAATSATAASDATIDEGVKIQKAGSKFNYEDGITEVENTSPLGEDELPTVLSDGKFVESNGDNKNSETYTQSLLFNNNNTAKLVFAQDDDTAPDANNYILIDRGTELYNYTLEFDSPIEYTNTSSATAEDDLKTSTIVIQGKTYTITNVEVAGSGAHVISKLTLLSGEAVLWITQNNPIKKAVAGVEHTIEVLDVTEDADACQVKVDDVTAIIDVDETKTINGVQVGITDVRAIHAQLQDVDVCQVSVGASELILENTKEVKVDDVDMDGTKVYFSGNGKGELDSIGVTYKASELDDDLYVAPGKEFVDPIFNSWKIVFGGMTEDMVTYTAKSSGSDNAEFNFVSNDGKAIQLPIYLNDTNAQVLLGEGTEVDEQMLAGYKAADNWLSGLKSDCRPTTADVTDCEGIKILATTSSGEVHIFEVSNIDFGATSNTTDIKDVTYGRTFNDVEFTPHRNTTTSLALGSFGSIQLIINGTYLIVNDSVGGKAETSTDGSLAIRFATAETKLNVTLNEVDRTGVEDIPDEMPPANITSIFTADSTNEEIDLSVNVATPGEFKSGVEYSVDLKDDSDYQVYVTPVGTKVMVDEENADSIKIDMPKAEVYGNVFVAPIVAQVSTSGSGVAAYTLTKLSVGAAKLDSEISDASASNLIVVGGPCANKVAASVLGKTYPACGEASGIAKDTAMLKAVKQSSGKIALVVAGWEAIDTRRATRVLANYDQYALTGSEVTVTGTSLTDIQVKKSA